MKADLYVQGRFWATIDLPDESLLALLAKNMITHAQQQAALLQQDVDMLGPIACAIHMRYTCTPAIKPTPGD